MNSSPTTAAAELPAPDGENAGNGNDESAGRRSRRGRSIRDAVSTSLLSKASSAVLQFASLPLAARVLGREEFGIYATVSTALLAVALLRLGVGPALGRGIAEASARSDPERERRLYQNGALLLGGLVILGVLLAGLVVATVPVPVLFGEHYASWGEEMTAALWTGIFLMAGQLVVAHTDRVREGYMEAASVNASSAIGNLVGALVILVGVRLEPSVPFLLAAIHLPNIVARLGNTVLLLRKRPHLVRGGWGADWQLMGELVRDGLSFFATSFVVYLVEFGICGVLIARLAGPGEVAIFQVLMSLTTAFSGLLIMVGTPFWAALVDARTQGDHSWMVTAARRYYGYLMILTAALGAALIAVGPMVLPAWYGPEFTPDRLLFVAHAGFLMAIGWRQVNRYLAIGLGLLPRTVWPILVGLVLGLLAAVPGLERFGLWALFVGMALGAAVLPGWRLPQLVWRELGRTSR